MMSLEKVSHLCIIAVSVVAICVLVQSRAIQDGQHVRPRPADFIGKRVTLPNVRWRTNNVVIAMTSHCPYCVRSVPLYQKLATAVGESPDRGALFVLNPEEDGVIKKFLADQHVSVTEVVRLPLNTLGIHATPTMLMVDGRGIVVNAFIGVLPAEKENVPLEYLKAGM